MKKFLFILLISLIPNFLIAQSLTCDIKINSISYSTYGLCVGDYVLMVGTPSGGTIPYTHSWTDGGSGQLSVPTTAVQNTFTAATPGTYTVVYSVTDAVFTTVTDTIIITVNPLPDLSTTNDSIICLNNCVNLTAWTSSGDGLIWYQGSVGGPILGSTLSDSLTVNVCPTVNTDYYALAYIASTGCTKTKKVTIIVVNLTATASASPNPICIGDTSCLTTIPLGGIGPYTYQWSPCTNISNCNIANPCVWPPTNTTYCVTVTDSTSGCTASACTIVTVDSASASITPSSPTICQGDNVQLCANAGSSYIWSPGGQTTQCITVSPATTTQYCVTVTDANGCTASACTIVTVDSASASITPSSPTICQGDSVQLCANAGSSYIWSPGGQTTQCITVNPATTTQYCVTVTAANSCTASACTIVTVDSASASITPSSPTICQGDSVQLCANAGSSYIWSPGGQTTQCITVSPATTTQYCVTVIDANGCTASVCATVTVNTATASISPPSALICSGQSINLCATVGGTSYLWSPGGQTTQCITDSPTTTTQYCVTVTFANGCTASACATVTVVTAPNAGITSNPSPPNICLGSCIILTATGGDGYLWNTTDITPSIIPCPNTTTTYTVTVTLTGCTAASVVSITVTVNPLPAANAGNDTTICQWSSVQLNGSGAGVNGTYSWSPVNYLTPPVNVSNPFATPPDTITYFLTVTDTNGCTDVDSVILYVLPFTLPVIIASDTGFCDTASVNATLDAGLGYTSYSWNTVPVQDTSIITITQPGCYHVTVTAANGCTAVSPDACIQVYPLLPIIMANGPTHFCQPDSVLLYLNNPYYTYEWSSGSINIPTIQVYETGDYYVTVTNLFGCVGYAGPKQIIVDPLPQAIISYVDKDNALLTFDFYSFSLYAASYYWDFGNPASGNNTSISENPSHNYTDTGTFIVMLIASNNCDSDTAYATVFVHLPTSGLTECSDISNFILYPNPTKGVINVDFTTSKSEQISLTLFDVLGRLLYRDAMSYYSGEHHKEINIESLPKGMYVLRITADKNTYNNRIIKE